MNPIITTKNLAFSYTPPEESKDPPTPVFADLDFSVEQGDFVAVLGHNGSGKSTLAKHFNAILLPSGGKVYVAGIDTSDGDRLLDIRRQVGMVFQNPDNQIVATIVEEDVAFAPENLGVPSAEIRERVDNALKQVGMYDYRKSAPHQLSGGQKQRIAIAGIVAMRPDVIVLDEPTAMLDPRGRREVMETIRGLNRNFGITVVHITHFMDEAAKCNRVVVMDGGKILLDDVPKKVFSQVELLKSVGLDVPQSTELIHLLRSEGIDLSEECITADECVEIIVKFLEDRGK